MGLKIEDEWSHKMKSIQVNETARLFWIFPFNAFDVNSYRKLSIFLTWFSSFVLFFLMYLVVTDLTP